MPILLLRSKKLKKPLEKFCRISNSASWEIDDYQSQPYPAKLFLWSLGKSLLMVFQPQGLRSDLTFCAWPKTLAKQTKQWMNISLPDCSEWTFFSFSLKFNHVHWLVPLNTYECPYSRRISLGAGSGEVDNFHSSRKDFVHWYWPSL